MSKFGELIESPTPVLLEFYTDWSKTCEVMTPVLREVAAALGQTARVIKIDIDKNKELAEALRVKELPTLMIYKDGDMKWRQSGEMDADTLVDLVKDFV